METFRFAYPQLLYLLLLIPLLWLLFLLAQSRKKRALKKFGDLNLIKPLLPYISHIRPIVKFLLLCFSLAFLIIAVARPQFGAKLQIVKTKGVEIMICLDVSNSMLSEDIKPNRLKRAKLAISKLINQLKNNKIGLIVFAGNAYIQLPLTNDFGAAKLFLSTVSTGNVPVQGTAIGSAINLAVRSFSEESKADKAIVIITDGENHEEGTLAAATNAKELGITIHTIGMGLSKGAPIPVQERKGQYKKDIAGNIIISKLDKEMLNDIAKAGKGKYIQANNTTTGLNKLLNEINKMNKTEMESKVYAAYSEKFQYFLGLSAFFFLLNFILLERKNKYLIKYNIFKVKDGK